MLSNGYVCISGLLIPPGTTQGSNSVQINNSAPSETIISLANERSKPPLCTSDLHEGVPGSLSKSTLIEMPTASPTCEPLNDTYGIKSCIVGGRKASVYDAGIGSNFRCHGVLYPENGKFVALYTPYDTTLAAENRSQPAPVNCGRMMNPTNQFSGKSATGIVIDRCASCIGKGGQLDDPTTNQTLVNGATVDLSRPLWNELFDDAPDNVYDVWYEGKVLQGIP
ncbi:uncharacterized protein M437DRAFT_70768 [Aureobasidium melanogenum CBS 110374]|uniref:Uncharacterized protein n=1 Tax=Aureobasidium melanogenum (strain CBS 110374) TaxID=1043003 RepID=A0A074VA20_AURM1|nr:uncharacterized protein M437DRAFT_70768 [Aureobasidium melanogenum CBS 110374]KEQ57480.1 hypothetical protein M437DRAFT_70768 [Aureobasidium melanogenum CBS 110374]